MRVGNVEFMVNYLLNLKIGIPDEFKLKEEVT